MPPKTITPVKPQKNLFSFFQKTPSTPSGASPAAASTATVEGGTGAGGISSSPLTRNHNVDTPGDAKMTPYQESKHLKSQSTPSVVVSQDPPVVPVAILTSSVSATEDTVKKSNEAPVKEGDDDSESDFSLAIKRKRSLKTGQGPTKKTKTIQNDDSEEEWMESASEASLGNEEEEEEEDDFIVDDDDDDEDYVKKPSSTSRRTKAAAVPKKPPLAKQTKAKTSGGNGVGGGSYLSSTPSRGGDSPHTASNTPLRSPHFPSPGSTNGSALFSTPGPSSTCSTPTPMATTTTGQNIQLPEGVVGRGSHEHNFLPFLIPDQRKDASGRRPTDPLYNPRTLSLPPTYLKDQTPAMVQWWTFKAQNMDTVLFFKVGKFYELFHMDADIGFTELDLIYMKGSKAHSGFPEVSYGKFASILVSKGYRVARIEQTETPEMLKERNDAIGRSGGGGKKKEKVVAREICAMMTRGTRTYCHLDDLSLLEDNPDASMSLLLSIKEGVVDGEETKEFGLCVVDTVLGTVTLAQFQDDGQLTRLRTFLARFHPSEILFEHGGYSTGTMGAVRLVASKARLDFVYAADSMNPGEVLKALHKGGYFVSSDNKKQDQKQEISGWPVVVKAIAEGLEDHSSDLVMMAFGNALWQLKRSCIDYDVLSMRKIFAYIPPDDEQEQEEGKQQETPGSEKTVSTLLVTPEIEKVIVAGPTTSSLALEEQEEKQKHMVLDEMALTNLEVLVNTYDRSETGSLWAFINRTKTSFGKRLLHSWLCHPLYQTNHILTRRAAVQELLTSLSQESETCRAMLKTLPDLERLLARVHVNGLNRQGAADHPDNRAVMYEMTIYNTRKIRDFADVLTGFEQIIKIGKLFLTSATSGDNGKYESLWLNRILPARCSSSNSHFPLQEIEEVLHYFRSIFDERQAKRDGNIKPLPGVNSDYDEATAEVQEVTMSLERYLQDMKKQTGISDMKYFGTNKDRFQLEIPMNMTSKVPKDWTSKSQKKTHRRYWTPQIEKMLAKLVAAEERVVEAQKDTLRQIFAKFDANRELWDRTVQCVAQLDALLALATVSSQPGYCWPEIIPSVSSSSSSSSKKAVSQGPQLTIVGGRHPMLEFAMAQRQDGEFIPNDLELGGKITRTTSETQAYQEYIPRLLLLTGPNMGGKSTLLRQTCLLVILAQIGCKVPAETMTLTPVDRIFTRIGASDRILHGQSTFYVELAETAMILHGATEDSLCILDELGRGTATFDGTAIAHSVVNHLVSQKRCRTLFATHYHLLIEDWEVDPRVRLGHMDCLVDPGSSDSMEVEEKERQEEVTFLYKLCDGASPKSYGIHVAHLAGVPQEVLQLAHKMSHGLEVATQEKLQGGASNKEGASSNSRAEYYRQVSAVFDALVSIFQQMKVERLSDEEFVYLVAELWKRYSSLRSHGHDH
eukprot:gene6940-7680_t